MTQLEIFDVRQDVLWRYFITISSHHIPIEYKRCFHNIYIACDQEEALKHLQALGLIN